MLLQNFDLRLLNSSQITFKVDSRSQPGTGPDDAETVRQLAAATSGAHSALRTLESVAAEGREWIRREQERYKRSVAEYAEIQHE